MSVHLYDVDSVSAESDISLDHLTTEQDTTQLHIDTSEGGGYPFTIQGFSHENINITTLQQHDQIYKVWFSQ